MDGNTHGMMEFALQKARAVAAWGFPTSGMEEAAKGTPGFAEAAYVVTVAGGIPVFSADGRTRIGGVGASGEAPADDAACAAAGIAAGPKVGEILGKLEEGWIASQFNLSREDLLARIETLAKS